MGYIYLSIALLIFVVAVPTIYASFIGAPLLWAPKKAIQEAFTLAGLKEGEKVYDLGSGSGRALMIAARCFGARANGFELSPPFYFFSRILLRMTGAAGATVTMKNFYNHNLHDADAVYCFLTPQAMARLKPKFESELKKGARVISYCFAIPSWDSQYTIKGYPGNVFIYKV